MSSNGLKGKGENSENSGNTLTSGDKTPSGVSRKEDVSDRDTICHDCILSALSNNSYRIFFITLKLRSNYGMLCSRGMDLLKKV